MIIAYIFQRGFYKSSKYFSNTWLMETYSGYGLKQLQVYDKEPESCRSKMFEYQVTFPPRYVLSFT